MEVGNGYKPSFIWKSLIEGRNLVKQGLRCLISDGNEINIFTDPWLNTHPPRSPQPIDDDEPPVAKVSELFHAGIKIWNRDLIEQIIRP